MRRYLTEMRSSRSSKGRSKSIAMNKGMKISESHLEDWLLDLCQVTHWHTVHFRPAMLKDGRYVTPVAGQAKGYVDYSLFKPGHYPCLVELKSEDGISSPEQLAWGIILKQCKGVRYILVKPSNREELEAILTEGE